MPRLSYRQRKRRQGQAQSELDSWVDRVASDPDLRQTYGDLPRAPIRLIVPPMGNFINQGGILRIAEAFRLERVFFEHEPDGMTDLSGGTGIWRWQPYEWRSADKAIEKAKADGYHVYGLTLAEGSIGIEAVDWRFPCALVLGEERHGLRPHLRDACDSLVAIPMYGLIGSLNVATACGITVNEAVRAYRRQTGFAPARAASRRLLGLVEDES